MAGSMRVRGGAGARVRVTGLTELRRALKELPPEHAKEVKAANLWAAQHVRDWARGKARSLGSVAAKSAPALSTAAGVASAAVKLDGSGRYPFSLGAEFGSGGRKNTKPPPWTGSTKQFQPWRGNGDNAGYFLWPTIRDRAEDLVEPYADAMQKIINRAFPG